MQPTPNQLKDSETYIIALDGRAVVATFTGEWWCSEEGNYPKFEARRWISADEDLRRSVSFGARADVVVWTPRAEVDVRERLARVVTQTALATRAEATAVALATIDRTTQQARETELAAAPTQTQLAGDNATAMVRATLNFLSDRYLIHPSSLVPEHLRAEYPIAPKESEAPHA